MNACIWTGENVSGGAPPSNTHKKAQQIPISGERVECVEWNCQRTGSGRGQEASKACVHRGMSRKNSPQEETQASMGLEEIDLPLDTKYKV